MACFSCYPKDRFVFQEGSSAVSNQWLQKRAKRSFKRYFQSVGVRDILQACESSGLEKNGEPVNWDFLLAETLERLKEAQEKSAQSEKRKEGKTLGRSRKRQQDLEEAGETSEALSSEEDLSEDDESDVEADLPVELLSLEPGAAEPSRDWITIGTVGHP
jgi:hypothetical protein